MGEYLHMALVLLGQAPHPMPVLLGITMLVAPLLMVALLVDALRS